MKALILSILLIASNLVFAQATIDLKTLIVKSKEVAKQQLDAWEIDVLPSTQYNDLWIGFNEGIQVEIKDGLVSTIWIEFTGRRSGAFPFPVDSVITPNIDIHEVIRVLGKPDETEDGFTIGDKTSGWVKWNTKAYQLHCEVNDSKVFMVTIMETDWFPGKD